MGWMKSSNFEKDKNLDKIGPHNSIDENLRILKERLTAVKSWFDFKVTKEKKFKLLYNNHELDLELKSGENLVATAKKIKDILAEYKQNGFDKKKYKFYKMADPTAEKTDTILKVNDGIMFDYTIWDWEEISIILWSNLKIEKGITDYDSVRRKKDINTWKVADFLNSILDDYFKG